MTDEAFVFNIVWTGKVFTYLQYFVASQLDHSTARFRFVVNGCPPEQVELMEQFAAAHPEQVVEVLVVRDEMGAHGVALDAAYAQRDDGDYFCFIDPDILARGPFLGPFAEALDDGAAGVTSGRGVWRDDSIIPKNHTGVSGEYFYDRDGYLFGSPHFAMYRRDAVEETRSRWDIGFGSVGPELSAEAFQRLVDIKRIHLLYDTGKLMNIFLQEEGHELRHFEHPDLMHIGGLSHYLSPPDGGGGADEAGWRPDETKLQWPEGRLEVAHYTAMVLRLLCEGRAVPDLPRDLGPEMRPRLRRVRTALIDLIAAYGPNATPT